MQKHIQHNKDEWTQKNIPLTLFERVRKGYERYYLWEVNKRLNRTATNWPPNSSGYSSISFPFPSAAQRRAWGPSLCWDMVLIPASSLQLIWTSCRRGYRIILRPPTSCKRHNSTLQQSRCPLISSNGCTCYLHGCISSFDCLAGVNMLQWQNRDQEKISVAFLYWYSGSLCWWKWFNLVMKRLWGGVIKFKCLEKHTQWVQIRSLSLSLSLHLFLSPYLSPSLSIYREMKKISKLLFLYVWWICILWQKCFLLPFKMFL